MSTRIMDAGTAAQASGPVSLVWAVPRVFFLLFLLQACAPARAPLAPLPPISQAPSPSPPQVTPLPKPQEPQPAPPVAESRIREETIKEAPPAPKPKTREVKPRPAPAREPPPQPAEDSSLIAKITARTPPRRAASLRLTEEGRKLLDGGDYAKALSRLEKTIAIDSTNPYGYFYLAKAHHHLGRYQESLNFLDVAESLLGRETFWLAEVFALKGENFRALGFIQRASSNYSEALRLNPGNQAAADGLSRVRQGVETPGR
ncbi:MAG: tetratricopeptide repeat protein [Deltaproteobacteria bacterium]|nr:tetratricopeptide repeat protein [Deltaproteobacteria bacterium]